MKYRRNYVPGGTYFFTVNLLDRSQSLLVDHIAQLRTAVLTVKRKRPFDINAWVVLPDHMHAIWTLPQDDFDYSSRWREIKKAFCKAIPAGEPLTQVRANKGERGIWQRRFWEHTIHSEEDFQKHCDYVYYNPVKHGLVQQVKDWPFSSFARDVCMGLYDENWAG